MSTAMQPIQLRDALGALALLPDDVSVTITVRKADLVAALTDRSGGPLIFSTGQAAKHLGYSAEQWRRWAQAGSIDGAYQDVEGGSWHLPRTACETHLAGVRRRGEARRTKTLALISPAQPQRNRPRGPWKAKARKRSTSAHS